MNAIDFASSYRAPAKINLSLEILEKRPDDYHDLISVMQTIGLYDVITISPQAQFSFSSSDSALASDNLVERTARLLARGMKISPTGHVHLEKHIPAGGGLGGGSSDAATALSALAQLWDTHATPDQLADLAAQLGSDVPFFLSRGTAVVEGRGERVRPLPDPPPVWYLLANPGIHVSTANVFAAVEPGDWSSGDATRSMAAAMRRGATPAPGPNGLERALARAYPEAHAAMSRLREIVPHAQLSGSGPTVFAAFGSETEAVRFRDRVHEIGYWTCVAPSVTAAEVMHREQQEWKAVQTSGCAQ